MLLAFILACAPGDGSTPAPRFDATHRPAGGIALTVASASPGGSVTFTATGLAPGDNVTFAASRAGTGAGPCPPALRGACYDLLAPVLRAQRATADASGTATASWALPASALPGDTWWIQAVYVDAVGAVLSQVETVVVEDDGCWDFVPRDWDFAAAWERSEVGARVVGDTVGACVGDALMLPTDAAVVWDDGAYTPPGSAADGLADGRSWASWDQAGVDCHLFRLTLEIPECPFGAVALRSPWYRGVPINDNFYVVIDNAVVAFDGTSYGVGYGGPLEVDTYLADPPEIDASWFEPGTNEILIVTEEYASWGGLGFIEPRLVP